MGTATKKPARGRTGQRSNLEPGHPGESATSAYDGSVLDPPAAGKRKPVARDYNGTTRSRISVARIARHPQNRTPAADDVDALAVSMAREGMLEPVVVRPIAGGGWQLVSGETRVLAARRLGWREIDAHVVACDDARALELLAVYNAQRQDLTPIDKARLIRQLCLPAEKGGAGLTRLEAAKIYRLESHAAASNLVRLLDLPEAWQSRVASGELPQSFARELLPLAASPRLMQVLEDAWQNRPDGDAWERDPFSSRALVEQLVRDLVSHHTRPVMQGHERGYSYQDLRDLSLIGNYPCLFKLTDTLRGDLDLVTINLAGKPVEVATNCELYDAYQIPAIKANKTRADGARQTGDADAASKSLTPKGRLEQLEKRIGRWRHAWLRSILVRKLEQPEAGAWPAIKLLLWLQSHDAGWKFRDVVKADATIADLADPGRRENAWAGLEAWTRRLPAGERLAKVAALAVQYSQAVLSAESDNPDMPFLPARVVDDLCRDYGIDLDFEWERMQSGATPADAFCEFFALYQSDQLDKLGEELGVFVKDAKTKAAKVKLFTTRDRILKRPKAIEGLEQPSSVGKRGKR